jgi:hypothetical protein
MGCAYGPNGRCPPSAAETRPVLETVSAVGSGVGTEVADVAPSAIAAKHKGDGLVVRLARRCRKCASPRGGSHERERAAYAKMGASPEDAWYGAGEWRASV